ncbi:MAG: DegV family protein [Chloroflexi bacterium CFX4]|nr:DegV family protein [Chloroflexi bacterium CFX4]MDL1922159.1 DegV family protein [Chloroflexi bacterium CFX3]
MPSKIKIVTDSAAHFSDPSVVSDYDITVVPLGIRWKGQLYREGVDLDAAAFLEMLNASSGLPQLVPPSADEFHAVYARLARETDRILSIHLSQAMHSTWQNAQDGIQNLLGRCTITVVDSKSIGLGLALMVEEAARLAETCDSVDEIVRLLRKQIGRLYTIFTVDRLAYLQQHQLLSQPQALLGTMLGIKPLLTIEDGELLAMEKVRTPLQTIDKFVEFMLEFSAVDQVLILQSAVQPTEQTQALIERLNIEFAARTYPTAVYQPSLACYLGPNASGIMVYEAALNSEGHRSQHEAEEYE